MGSNAQAESPAKSTVEPESQQPANSTGRHCVLSRLRAGAGWGWLGALSAGSTNDYVASDVTKTTNDKSRVLTRNAILLVALAAFLALFIGEFRFQSTYWNVAYLDSEFVQATPKDCQAVGDLINGTKSGYGDIVRASASWQKCTAYYQGLAKEWICPCSYSTASADVSIIYPGNSPNGLYVKGLCADILDMCQHNNTFRSLVINANPDLGIQTYSCPGLDLKAPYNQSMYYFCDLVDTIMTMGIPFVPQLTTMATLHQLYVQSLNDVLRRVKAAVQVNALSALKPGVAAFTMGNINSNIIYNAVAGQPSLYDDLIDMYTQLAYRWGPDPSQAQNWNNPVRNATWTRLIGILEAKGYTSIFGLTYPYARGQFHPNWNFTYMVFAQKVCKPQQCTRVLQKTPEKRFTEAAGLAGGLIGLVFTTILPKLWSWAIMPIGSWCGVWRLAPS